MAMRVVTVDKLRDFIEDKCSRKVTLIKNENSIQFVDNRNNILCNLEKNEVSNFTDETPFLKFRDQVSGVLQINKCVVSDDEIKPYSFLLD